MCTGRGLGDLTAGVWGALAMDKEPYSEDFIRTGVREADTR